jgi:hypothetical protein
LAALQRVRELEDQLAAAAAREALLRDSIAARDDTIRCPHETHLNCSDPDTHVLQTT